MFLFSKLSLFPDHFVFIALSVSWIQNLIFLRILICSIFWSFYWFLALSVSFRFLLMSGHPWPSLCARKQGTRKWIGASVCLGRCATWGLSCRVMIGQQAPLSIGGTQVLSFLRDCSVSRSGEGWRGHLAGEEVIGSGMGPKAQCLKYQAFPQVIQPGPSSRHLWSLVGWIFLSITFALVSSHLIFFLNTCYF